jgi:hypothetical protein
MKDRNERPRQPEKLFEALHDLFSKEGLAMGLTYAHQYLLQVRDVPSEFKTEFEEIKAALTGSPSETDVTMSPVRFRPWKRLSWRDVF